MKVLAVILLLTALFASIIADPTSFRLDDQLLDQAVEQSISQSNDQSITQSNDVLLQHVKKRSVDRSDKLARLMANVRVTDFEHVESKEHIDQLIARATPDDSIKQPIKQSNDQSDRPMNPVHTRSRHLTSVDDEQSVDQSIDQSIDQSLDQSVTPLSVHPTNQSLYLINQSINPSSPVGRIPLIVHYVYGLRKSGDVTFDLDDFISVKGAFDMLKVRHVFFWVRNIPSGVWWEAMLELGEKCAKRFNQQSQSPGQTSPQNCIEIKQVRDVDHVFGRIVKSSAHKADVIRMEALLTYGGVYMDMDVVPLKPIDKLIERYSCILGQEQTATGTHPHGLGNAYMLTNRNAPFFAIWYEAYRRFDYNQWAALSIHLPIRLARSYPLHVHQLGPEAMYWPSFDAEGRKQMYDPDVKFDLSRNYGVHLWSGGKKERKQKTFEELCALNNTWGKIARTVLLAGDGNEQICGGRGIE